MWNGKLRVLARPPSATFAAVPTGTVDLVTIDELARHVLADLLRHREHVAQVGRAVLVGRRADGDEHDVAPSRWPRATSVVNVEPALLLIALDESSRPGLVDRQDVLLQAVDLRCVDVRADDVRCPSRRGTRRRRGRRSRCRRR